MRVAPVGAYFADDLDAVVEQARLVDGGDTRAPRSNGGAIAVAVAAAYAWRLRDTYHSSPRFSQHGADTCSRWCRRDGFSRPRITRRRFGHGGDVRLGNGSQVSAQDTVPFVLWCAGEHLDNYEEALWLTVSGLGDRDTTCAMVGGIVALSAGADSIPASWRQAREPLPRWPFQEQNEL